MHGKPLLDISAAAKNLLSSYTVLTIIGFFIYWQEAKENWISDFHQWSWAQLIYFSLICLCLPETLMNLFGILFFNPYPDSPQLEYKVKSCPHLCIRIVYHGDHDLSQLKQTFKKNINILEEIGYNNFAIEYLTKSHLNLPNHPKVRQIILPSQLSDNNKELFKIKALKYCQQKGVNKLALNDWILYLSEESLLTKDAVYGIINFISHGKYHFGQGVSLYDRDRKHKNYLNFIQRLIVKVSQSLMVANQLGKMKTQLNIFHRRLFYWSTSFMVVKNDVFYDRKSKKSLRWGFIEGQIKEIPSSSFREFLQQKTELRFVDFYRLGNVKTGICGFLCLTLSCLGNFIFPFITIFCPFLNGLFAEAQFIGLIEHIIVGIVQGTPIAIYLVGIWAQFDLRRISLSKYLLGIPIWIATIGWIICVLIETLANLRYLLSLKKFK